MTWPRCMNWRGERWPSRTPGRRRNGSSATWRRPGADEPELVAAAKLDLAACYEARGEPGRAIETLRRAARARPGDPTPFEHLAELQLRRQDPRGAVEALRGAAARLGEARAQAALALKIGAIQRDVARDPSAAAAAFRQAADLDPLGEGAATLVSLHDAAGDAARRAGGGRARDCRPQAIARRPSARRASAGAARAMAGRRAPPGQRRRRRRCRGRGGERAAGWPADAGRRCGRLLPSRPRPGGRFSPRLPIARPAASSRRSGHTCARRRRRCFRRPRARGRRPSVPSWRRASPGSTRPRRPSASGGSALFLAREPGATAAEPIDDGAPALILAPDALSEPALRFHVGRALGLLAQQAVVLERTSAAELAPLFACAALLAGGQVPGGLVGPGGEPPARRHARRREEGLEVAGAAGLALRVRALRSRGLADGDAAGGGFDSVFSSAEIRRRRRRPSPARPRPCSGNPAAIDLLGFALGDRYPALRRAVEGASADGRRQEDAGAARTTDRSRSTRCSRILSTRRPPTQPTVPVLEEVTLEVPACPGTTPATELDVGAPAFFAPILPEMEAEIWQAGIQALVTVPEQRERTESPRDLARGLD